MSGGLRPPAPPDPGPLPGPTFPTGTAKRDGCRPERGAGQGPPRAPRRGRQARHVPRVPEDTGAELRSLHGITVRPLFSVDLWLTVCLRSINYQASITSVWWASTYNRGPVRALERRVTDLHARGPNGSVATPGNPKGTPCMAASHVLTKQVSGNNHPTTTAYTIGQGYGDSPRDDLHSKVVGKEGLILV